MKKILLILIVVSALIGGLYGYLVYKKINSPNVSINKTDGKHLYIPTGTNFEDLLIIIQSKGIIINIDYFEWIAEKKNYINNVKPGKYKLKDGMTNNEFVNLLRSGEQESVKVTFNNVRTIEQLAGKVAVNLETDSVQIDELLKDPDFIKKYGFNKNTIISLFIPNTYEFYWNTSAKEFVSRMAIEYKKFWNTSRKAKAKKLNLSQSEVATLASIVQKETIKSDEKPRVAGVYLNRIRRGMLLQADPTVIYAIGDFSMKRVLRKHLKYDSPYNTYMYKGLPPGPICIPNKSSIDAVLSNEKHKYIFFCAKADFSGYHSFAVTLSQHNANARKYQRALNKRRIYK